MIGPPSNTKIWIAAGVTDLGRGFIGPQRPGADQAGEESALGTSIYFSRPPRGSGEIALV